jgi:hypothetical protein
MLDISILSEYASCLAIANFSIMFVKAPVAVIYIAVQIMRKIHRIEKSFSFLIEIVKSFLSSCVNGNKTTVHNIQYNVIPLKDKE